MSENRISDIEYDFSPKKYADDIPRDHDEIDNEQKILDEIDQNINNWISYNNVNITNFRNDKYFAYVDNWTAQERSELLLHNKPILQMNLIYDSLNKVNGEQRQHTAELQVKSLDGVATEQDIKLNEDWLRHVCFNSKSRITYQTAFGDATSGGFGAWRIYTDYEHPDSFHLSPFIGPIKDPEKTFFDPYSQDPTKCDGHYCGYYMSMNRADFEKSYPDISYPSSFPVRVEMQDFTWGLKDKITLVEYYKKEYFKFKLHLLNDGRAVRDEEWKEIQKQYAEQKNRIEDFSTLLGDQIPPEAMENIQSSMPGAPYIVETKERQDCKIVMYKAIYDKVIERKEFPGNELPIIFVQGGCTCIDGQDRLSSFIRYARDAQRFHNYQAIEIAYALKTSRREQFIGTPSNIAGLEEVWKNVANQQGMLPAIPDPITGQMPIKLPPNEVPQTLMALFQQSQQSVQSILGFYEANRGADSMEKSGVAIKEQQRTGNMSVAVFYDNLNRAIEQTGRVLMSMRPYILDTERKIPVMTQNGKSDHVMINQEGAGGVISNDMTKGKYDVVIDAGPSAAVQKAQSLQILIDLARILPQAAQLTADYIGENLGLDNTPGIVDRLKTLVPPEILAKEEGKPPPPQQPDPQAQMMQAQIQLKEKGLEIQMGKLQMDMQKMHIEMQKMETELKTALINKNAEVKKAELDHNAKVIETQGKIIESHNELRKDALGHLANHALHSRKPDDK
jgi:hypothetical protein